MNKTKNGRFGPFKGTQANFDFEIDLIIKIKIKISYPGQKMPQNSNLLSELKKNNSLKSYNLMEKAMGTQDPRVLLIEKVHILKFC